MGVFSHALALYDAGFCVIPIKAKGKEALVKWEKFTIRRPQKPTIERWVSTWPDANIGVLTGLGFVVIDVDGEEGIEIIKTKTLPPTLIEETGRGFHYLYKTSDSMPTRNLYRGRTGEKVVDLRGLGGYIVVAPSIHPSGKVYSWNMEATFENMAELPKWVKEIHNEKENTDKKWWDRVQKGVGEGERNDTATKLAGHLIGKDTSPEDTYMWLKGWNTKNRPPMGDKELQTIVDSISRKEDLKRASDILTEKVESITLEQCKKVVDKWLYFKDTTVVDLVIAGTLSILAKEDPVWLLLVSAPSMGKTELLRAMRGSGIVYYVGEVTKNTFFSGLKGVKGILEKIGNAELSIINKDLASILTMPHNDKVEVLGQLREMFDGLALKEFGNGKKIEWSGRVNYLAGVTPDIENHYAVIRALGERFLYYNIPNLSQEERHEMLKKSKLMERHSVQARKEIAEAMQGVLGKYAGADISPIPIDDSLDDWLRELVNVTTILRTHVSRDGYTKEMMYKPAPEGPARVYKALKTLLKTIAIIREHKEIMPEDYDVAVKICLDSIPSLRRETLRSILRCTKPEGETAKETAERTNFQTTGTSRINLDDLAAVGVVDRVFPRRLKNEEITKTASYLYKISKEIKDKMESCGIIDVL